MISLILNYWEPIIFWSGIIGCYYLIILPIISDN